MCVCVRVCLSSWQNVILETPIVACLAVDRFWQHDSVKIVQDAVTKLHSCVADQMKLKDKLRDRCGLNKGT